jgi:hypothetical protein
MALAGMVTIVLLLLILWLYASYLAHHRAIWTEVRRRLHEPKWRLAMLCFLNHNVRIDRRD